MHAPEAKGAGQTTASPRNFGWANGSADRTQAEKPHGRHGMVTVLSYLWKLPSSSCLSLHL